MVFVFSCKRLLLFFFVSVLNDNMGGLSFYEDTDGNKYVVGADAVPKKLGSKSMQLIGNCGDSSVSKTFDCTSINSYHNFNVDDFIVCLTGLSRKSGSANSNSELTKNYNASQGTLTISPLCYSTNGYVFFTSYKVYVLA